jgi:ketosteroid isomerase-like protein
MNRKEIANAFSNGQFEKVYGFIATDAVWTVVEESRYSGKQEIIDQCNQVAGYFQSVTTNFETHHIISEGNVVMVNGTAEFIRKNEVASFVSACDLYEFNDQNEIEKITSYCIQKSI